MSECVDVAVRWDGEAEKLAGLVEPYTGELERVGDAMVGVVDGVRAELGTNVFDDDGPIKWSAYQYTVSFRAVPDDKLVANTERRDAMARSLFDELKEAGIGVMLVHDIGAKLDEWGPPSDLHAA